MAQEEDTFRRLVEKGPVLMKEPEDEDLKRYYRKVECPAAPGQLVPGRYWKEYTAVALVSFIVGMMNGMDTTVLSS